MSHTPHNVDLKQASAVLNMNAVAKAAGLPTYTELEAQLTELAMYVKRDVSSEAMQASAQRSIELLTAKPKNKDIEFLGSSAEGLDLSIAHDRAIFRERVARRLKGCSMAVMRGWIGSKETSFTSLAREIADAYIGG